MNNITKQMLNELEIAKLDGAYNIRENGASIDRSSTKNITISSLKNKNGLSIKIASNTKNEKLFIPVVLTQGGINDIVYNDFYIGDNVNVTIYAGCALHNTEENNSIHEGIHSFYIGKNSNITYIEKHIGNCEINNNKTINTKTIIKCEKNSQFTMNTIQLRGVDKSNRITEATLESNSKLIIEEKLLTGNNETVNSNYEINLNGKDSGLTISSRAISKDNSKTNFKSNVIGNNKCFGHIECDAIIMDNAKVISTPAIIANNKDASLSHEAAIGKIAKDQINKLMSLGLTKTEAEETIINSFLN